MLTLPDSIAWLLNIRGQRRRPQSRAAGVRHRAARRQAGAVHRPGQARARGAAHISTGIVRIEPPDRLRPSRLGATGTGQGQGPRRSRRRPPSPIASALGGARRDRPRQGSLHRRQGDQERRRDQGRARRARARRRRHGRASSPGSTAVAPTGSLDEIAAVRRAGGAAAATTGALEEISFDTISGSGPNGAIVHYRVTEATNRKLQAGELFLVDSGAQYRDGTTDITRTHRHRPADAPRCASAITLVLKGHIAIATARFPKGTRGIDLDALARRALWETRPRLRPRHRPRRRQLPLGPRGAAVDLQGAAWSRWSPA